MKTFGNPGIAVAALLILSACGGDKAGEQPARENSDQPVVAQGPESGDASGTAPVVPKPGGAPTGEAAPVPVDVGEGPSVPAEPPAAFMQCRSCHSIEPGKNGIGPSLAGIAGKPAASVAGFRYSSALQGSGITWSRDKLDEWLAGPTRMVPGTRMVTMVRNEEQRKAILDYLETLK